MRRQNSPLTPVPFQQMVDSISQLMCCGFALLNFTQSISQSYHYKCIIQQAQLYVLTWKMRISFPAKINQKAHAPHLCTECAAPALQRKMHLWSIDALFAFLLGRITGMHWCQHKAQCWQTLWRWKSAPGAGTVGGSCQCCSLACLSWAKLYKLFLKSTHSNASDSEQNCTNLYYPPV